jgi:hypothetical protein
MKKTLIPILFALLALNGCSDDSTAGAGGTAGSGGTAGTGGTAGAGGMGGSAGMGGSGGAGGVPGTEYIEDFESLDQASATALGDDPHPDWGVGWLVFGNVTTPGGMFVGNYGAFPAPNNTGAFSGIALGQGGVEQGAQVLVIISDYNNRTEQEAGNLVEGITYRERTITADDVGKTMTFSFDAKRGNINDPTGDSTALAFIKTLDPDNSFATTNFETFDTTNLPDTWMRYEVSLVIDASLDGQVVQFGFSATATNDEPSGVFYDNLLVVTAAP